MRPALALAALLALPAAAQDGEDGAPDTGEPVFAFDNAACPAFLTGVWLANSQQDIGKGGAQALWHVTEAMVLNETGISERAFAAGVAGDEPEETKTAGTWAAGPGAAKDRCNLAFVYEEGERQSSEVTVESQSRIQVDGQPFTRLR